MKTTGQPQQPIGTLLPPELNSAGLNLLQNHRGGGAANDFGEKLTELVQAVRATGKGGVLTLQIGIKPADRGVGAVVIKDKITLRAPQEESESSIRFTTHLGQLVKDDPRQKELAFRAIQAESAEVESTPSKLAANA